MAVFCDEEILKARIVEKLGARRRGSKRDISRAVSEDISRVQIMRRAIDAREDVKFVYTLDFDSEKKLKLQEVVHQEIVGTEEAESFDAQEDAETAAQPRPVVVGFGPCGMFCALVLARAGLKPIVIERGSAMDERIAKVKDFWENKVLDPECNVQFGEGGAGTFSDGKLNTGIKDTRIRFVLETFVNAGAAPDILIDARPHIGTDVLRDVVKNIREEIIARGGNIYFDTKLEEIELRDCLGVSSEQAKRISRIKIKKKNAAGTSGEDFVEEYIDADNLVLALGHSARDTVRYLFDAGLNMEAKPFSMGVRVQHPQELIDRATYGNYYGHPALPPAYYKLSYRAEDGRGVYSFCMCPGGEIVNAASQEGGVVTNGMSNAARASGFANSGILVDVRVEDYLGIDSASTDRSAYLLAGIAFQEKYERLAFINGGSDYTLPQTTWGAYRNATVRAAKVIKSLPDFVANDIREAMPVFGRRLNGFDNDDALMVAIESRSSSPVRILRNKETLEALHGIYPGGEGAGYAGGITSAACDGIRIAEKIIEKKPA
ncbi:MAG: NAD(FAD)-utilizing dehydrogenase [Firmicutes bacterium]|nr:NAD(FAD)-utilizing dehydrogenase [Bacillota bacterium]